MCGKAITPPQTVDAIVPPPPPPPAQTDYTTATPPPVQRGFTPQTPPPPAQTGYAAQAPPPSQMGYTPAQPPPARDQSARYQAPGYPPTQTPQQPGRQTYTPHPAYPQQPAWTGAPPPQPQAPKRKKKKGKVIGLSLLALFVLLVAGVLIFSLPLRPVIQLEGTRQTIDGTIRDLSFTIKTNQLIREVSYALNPSDPTDIDAYTKLEGLEGGPFKKTGSFPTLNLDKTINQSSKERGPWTRTDHNAKIGNHTLYITVKTMFGTSKPIPFNLHYASGISALPDRSKIKRVKDESVEKTILTNEIIVSLDYGSDRSVAETLAAETGGEIVGEIPSIFRYQFRYKNVDEEKLESILNNILESPHVTSAQYNYVYNREETQFYPNDKLFDSWDVENPDGNNWGLEVIRAPLVWQNIDSLTPISIGIADGGLEYDHEDLSVDRSNIYLFPTHTLETIDDLELFYAKSKKSEGSNYFAKKEHGTHVTGIMAEKGNNGIGAAGVNWNTVPYFFHYWHMGINEETGELDLWNVTTSFELEVTLTTLVEQGCRVINFSVGDSEPSDPNSKHEFIETQAYGDLCLRLEQLGYDFLVFKAAGNKARDASDYEMNRIMTGTDPGRRHTVIVASIENTPIDFDDDVDPRIKYAYRLSDFSNYGALIDVAAPGTDIFSTMPNQSYASISGTSMASPMAAGVASLIYGAHPEYTASEVKAILMERTDTFTTDGTNLIPVVNAALSSDFAKTGDIPQVPPGEIIPDPTFTPYPGPPKPYAPDAIRLPGHSVFTPIDNMGGFTGFVSDGETNNRLAFFSIHFTDADGQVIDMDYTFPYHDFYEAQQLGEFYSLVTTNGGETLVSDLVIKARGYKSYEVPAFTVSERSVVDLGTIALEAESEDYVRLPGHTPFPTKEGWGGFAGFVYDAATKMPIPKFAIENYYDDFETGEPKRHYFEYVFPPSKAKYAQLQGEYMILVDVQGTKNTIKDLTIYADGYVSHVIGNVDIVSGVFTDLGVVYLERVGAAPDPEPQPSPDPDVPAPASGVIESITLEWGSSPHDLDLHLTAPFGGDGSRFHIFAFEGYRSYDAGAGVNVTLTKDSSAGYGPEVITVKNLDLSSDIPFSVYVHDFTNLAKESGSKALANSGAKVSIKFKGKQQPLVFNVPSREGTLWKVCTIHKGKVTAVNTMSYEGRPLNIGASD